jgi:hypothetical protein
MNGVENDFFFGLLLLLLLAVIGCVLLSITVNHRDRLLWQFKLFGVALSVRFFISIVVYEFGLVDILGDEDSSGWYGGVVLLKSWIDKHVGLFDLPGVLAAAFDTRGGHHAGYQYMLALLFYFTDSPARMPAAALNCFYGALTVVFVYRIGRTLFTPWVAERAAWLVCFFPSLVVWSAQTVKEPVVILLETVALYACIRLKKSGFSLGYIAICAVAIVLLIPFRFYASYIVAAAVVLSLVIPHFQKRKTSVLTAVAVGALIVAVVAGGGLWAQNEAEFDRFDMNRVEKFKSDVAFQSGSGVENNYDLHSPTGFVAAVTVGGLHLLLAPFPWQMFSGHTRMLLSIPELLVWWWLFFAGLIPGVIYALKKRFFEIQPAVFFILGMGLLYSMVFGNVGLVFRQRAQLLPWLLIFVVVGLQERMLRKKSRQRVWEASNAAMAGVRAGYPSQYIPSRMGINPAIRAQRFKAQ